MRQILILLLLASLFLPVATQSFIPGYKTRISGEDLSYHAPQPDATTSLLVRSEDASRYIEWESSKTPGTWSASWRMEPGTFLLLAGIDVNPEDPHQWKVFVNDRHFFTISSPTDTLSKTLTWPGPEGSSLVFKASEVDKYGDLMGYLFCQLPASALKPGEPVRFRVTGESAGSRTWFMVFQYEAVDKVSLVAEQAVMRGQKGNSQLLRADIVRYAEPEEARITIAGKKLSTNLVFGHNTLYLPVPQITQETTFGLTVKAGKEVLADESFTLQAVQPRTIYLLHHSHVDIGYTHVQPEVEAMQWENIDRAVELINLSKDFPPGARLKWCSEVMWAVESYYDKASPEKKQAFREAVKSGHLELNGLYANELVSLCGPEELDRLMETGRRITRECGVELTSAMITDIPGWSWALVPAMANSGMKYLSLGTNRGHRIGNIVEVWADKPFYWTSPSGEEKVLCWVHGEGYSLFHTGLAYSAIRKRLQEDLVFNYLNDLSNKDYPYREVMLRYNIGSDNGPVDETLPAAVKEWNEKYVTPQIIISTVEEAFSAFEKEHGSDLPEVSGDITCYWEDGAYSTARETIQTRRSASRLLQAQALWAMYNPSGYPEEKTREAWRQVLLFDEHTWGSWNSISEPEAPFTQQQWEIKKSFATEAEKQSKKLFFDAMVSKVLGGPAADAVEVINSCGWERSGLVTISGGTSPETVSVLDPNGAILPVQIMSDGNIAFIAKGIPAFASKIYKIKTQSANQQTGQPAKRQLDQLTNHPIETSRFIMKIDPETGSVSSLIWKKKGTESRGTESLWDLVETSPYSGLNEYLYVEGRMPDNPLKAKLLNISMIDNGPLLTAIRLDLEAPGCASFTTTIRIIDELDQVEIINTFDRHKVYGPEAVHIAFPFNIPGGTLRYDLAYGYCRPETDQVPGSNKNFLAMEHWLDISNNKKGLTVICPDAPLFEVEEITMDAVVLGWADSIPPSQTFFSYLMNNYWETNFSAAQQGTVFSRYIIMPHEGFDPAVSEKAALGQRQPLITRKGGGWMKEKSSLLSIKNESLVITSIKPINQGKELLISLYNAGLKEEMPEWEIFSFNSIYRSDPDGIKSNPYPDATVIPPGGIRYFKVVL